MLRYQQAMQNFGLSKLICISMLTILFGCNSNIRFTPQNIAASVEPTPLAINDEVTEIIKPTEQNQNFEQNYLEKNKTAVSFQVTKPDGQLLEDLNPQDINLFENNMAVNQFKLNRNSQQFRQIVDIIFAVDVTASMAPTIEAAKLRLINFVNQSRKAGYRTRMCLITFGDYTVKKCDKFYDNNPDDPATQLQVAQLIAEINQLKALKGSQDPGGKDKNENPMRALIDASKSPWASNNQRFLILMTDDGFLYSPGNSGTVGALAPKYSEIKSALITSQMKVFAATPSLAGYNKNFGNDPSIVSLSQGEWFNFSDLINGKISLDTILNRILTTVNTTFIAEYISDDNLGLDPTLPVSQRVPKIELKNSALGTLSPLQLKSNLPNGRENYKDEFKLSDKKIRKNSVKIFLDGIEITSGFNISDDGKVKFIVPPKAGAKLTFKYENDLIKDSFQLRAIKIKSKAKDQEVFVEINGHLLDHNLFAVMKSDENYKYVVISNSVLDENDSFDIKKNNELQIKVKFSYAE